MMSKDRHLGRYLAALAAIVLITLAYRQLTAAEPSVSIDFSTFYATHGSTFNTTRAVDIEEKTGQV